LYNILYYGTQEVDANENYLYIKFMKATHTRVTTPIHITR
jgi:hypothetical protein